MLRQSRILHLLLAGAGLGLAITLFRLWVFLLTNLYVPGSLDWSHPLVVPLALALTGVCMASYAAAAYHLRRAPPIVIILLAVLAVLAAFVAYPIVCDTRESFLDHPNHRCSCAGLPVRWYPRGTFDYADVEYCIGVEMPFRQPR